MADVMIAAGLLAIERIVYILIARDPHGFRRLLGLETRAEAVESVRRLFYVFKALQIGVFGWWILRDGVAEVASGGPAVVAAGLTLMALGQVLNLAVFRRLGTTGTFYGAQFGYALPRITAFPFSWFRHPQYLGTVLSIWGLFLAARYPDLTWYVLPAIETVYYAVATRCEP